MTGVDCQACYGLPPGHRMQWEEAQQAWVILYPEGMIKLNDSAAETLRHCDGATPLTAVIADLEKTFGETGLEADVLAFVSAAVEQGWLIQRQR